MGLVAPEERQLQMLILLASGALVGLVFLVEVAREVGKVAVLLG
jgi:hypothetical protein